jgi:hypothetical protein
MSERAPDAVGVRIGTRSTPNYELHNKVIPGHWNSGRWVTNQRPKQPWPVGTPVIASLCQTVKFTLGEVAAAEIIESQVAGRWDYAIPVAWERVIYLGDPNNPVLQRVSNQTRTWRPLTSEEFVQAFDGLTRYER